MEGKNEKNTYLLKSSIVIVAIVSIAILSGCVHYDAFKTPTIYQYKDKLTLGVCDKTESPYGNGEYI